MNSKLKDVFKYFFKLGFIAFGGPAAHVAMMQDDLVERKKWLSTEQFLDYMGATNLIPGPNSTEMTMHCGYHRAGVGGLFVAGMSFIFPAVLITLLVAIFFENISQLAWTAPIIAGIKASVLSFIAGAILKLSKKAVKNYLLLAIGVIVLIASLLGINEILAILAAGFIALCLSMLIPSKRLNVLAILPALIVTSASYTPLKLFFVFLKVGAVLFGSGYVLFAYLDGELIDNLGWLTHSDLVEAIAIGQITPGPVLSTATFIGYKVGGISGAVLATLGIFIPSFFYVWLLNPIVKKIRQNPQLTSFLEAVNVAAVAVMIAVTFKMAESILVSWQTIIIATVSFVVYFFVKKINPLWIIVGGGVLGYILNFA
ncbi:MAG: chromate efflux transporter [Saprospiraceae bacterium]|nr:chromate efflux transporter [Saprospiraceae bacterium]